jgi:dipeptidyl aminopeptidase/acylaminoacyl peptidase
MLRLAGLRIDPDTNGPHLPGRITALTLKSLPGGDERPVALPVAASLDGLDWSPDGKRFALLSTMPRGIELWVGEVATGKVKRLPTPPLNDTIGSAVRWAPDSQSLICLTVPAGRGKAPAEASVPTGPTVQDADGKAAPVRTYQDLLQDAHDEALFDFYGASQPVRVDVRTGRAKAFGAPGLYTGLTPSPDGKHLLVSRLHRPYSYRLTYSSFPTEVTVTDADGKAEYAVVDRPLADRVPIEGVQTGRRAVGWQPTEPATLTWVEALDGGDPKKGVPARDALYSLAAPFTGAPVELAKTRARYAGVRWFAKGGTFLLSESDPIRRRTRTLLCDAKKPGAEGRVIWERSAEDRYNDPGTPILRALPDGGSVLWQDTRGMLYLSGAGASPEGDRPFLDRFDVQTGKAERLFRSAPGGYETVTRLLADDGSRLLTRRESRTDPPNYFLRAGASSAPTALTRFIDPAPQLRGIQKQLVTYKRPDGVPLSFTLYLPAGYKPGTRLPTIVWAYPREFVDADSAGQVSGSADRFTTISGYSHLFLATQGYAILDGASLPVVGDREKQNDTYIEQIVAGAKAAIDKAAEMGVCDPERVGVGGHSYGAFMTANLLAHSDLFRAGVARSGAYNRTLTPFGFQAERRTLWEAPQTYLKLSPMMYADRINEPLLFIHGQADDNPGTFPIQSERMFEAVRGNGGVARLVLLPGEAHGYRGRESVEHTLWEMVTWFDRHVKNAPPRAAKAAPAAE